MLTCGGLQRWGVEHGFEAALQLMLIMFGLALHRIPNDWVECLRCVYGGLIPESWGFRHWSPATVGAKVFGQAGKSCPKPETPLHPTRPFTPVTKTKIKPPANPDHNAKSPRPEIQTPSQEESRP